MIMDYLHSFYRRRVRIQIGDEWRWEWIRWFRAAADAKVFPTPHCFFSRTWTNQYTEPWPTGELDPRQVWDRGDNPGYPGQDFLGDPAWFAGSPLPAGVLTDPTPPLPAYCCAPPQMADIGFILGLMAVPGSPMPAVAQGGVVLGGRAGPPVPALRGGIVLGCTGEAESYPPARLAGGIVLGGVGRGQMASGPSPGYSSPSGSSGGGDITGCSFCPSGAAAQFQFTLSGISNSLCAVCAGFNATWTVTYSSGCNWTGGPVPVCAPAGSSIVLTITSSTVSLLCGPFMWSASSSGWNCLSPITLSTGLSIPACHGGPLSVVVSPA